MACILVHTEVVDGRPTPMARAILGEGRRIASSLGGALYAVAWVPPGADAGVAAQELAAELGGGGADRVVLVATPPRPPLWVTRGALLARVCEQVRPSLIILPSDAGGRDIAPRLAARLGGVFVAEPLVETGPRGEVVLTRAVYDGELWRRLQLDELDQAAVITLSADRPPAQGADEIASVDLQGPVAVVVGSEDKGSRGAVRRAATGSMCASANGRRRTRCGCGWISRPRWASCPISRASRRSIARWRRSWRPRRRRSPTIRTSPRSASSA